MPGTLKLSTLPKEEFKQGDTVYYILKPDYLVLQMGFLTLDGGVLCIADENANMVCALSEAAFVSCSLDRISTEVESYLAQLVADYRYSYALARVMSY